MNRGWLGKKKHRWALWACVACAAWSACACSNRAALADLSPPKIWTDPKSAWWHQWQTEALSVLIEDALKANPNLLQSQAQWRRAVALRQEAEAGLRPHLDLYASLQRGNSLGDRSASASLWQTGLDATWNPDWAGTATAQWRTAQADEQAASWMAAAQAQTVAAEVAVNYFQWLGVQSRLKVARENLLLQEETARLVGWRLEAGLTSELEWEQARSAVSQTRAQMPVLEQSATLFESALAVWTGGFGRSLQVVKWNEIRPVEPSVQWPAQLLRSRADVMAAEAQMEAALHRWTQAEAARAPQWTWRLSSLWSAHTLASLGQSGAVATLVAQLNASVWDGGARIAQASAQRAALEVAGQAYLGRILAALQDEHNARTACVQAQKRLQALAEAEQSAQATALLAQDRYAQGLVDFQTVLDAQRTLLGVQDTKVLAQVEWAIQHVRWAQAVGGSWDRP